ncbi:MAG TPA: nitrate/nitrite transporter NrtS, partial [Dehalococcoidia bacterium]|nr:nitrate/nitrite transporter NrtS [Dehalococcoidia bacterium]
GVETPADQVAMPSEERTSTPSGLWGFLVLWFQQATVRRAVIVAMIVGPVLTLINQYDAIASGSFGARFFFKMGLTFLVPYSVSSYSSVMALRAAQRSRSAGATPVQITIYPIAGKQLWFHIPDSFCRECDLTIRTVEKVVDDLDNPSRVQVRVRPWLSHLPEAIRHGGWHPPIVTINGKRFSQGVVPDAAALRQEIEGSLTP